MEGAASAYVMRCGDADGVVFLPAPGAFELTVIAAAMAASGRFDALVAIGCIIKGDTPHDQHLARAVTDGLTRVSIDHRMPVGLGVLTVNNARQARERAGGRHGNKGEEAMNAALDSLAVLRAIRSGEGAVGSSQTLPDKAAARAGHRASPVARGRGRGAGRAG